MKEIIWPSPLSDEEIIKKIVEIITKYLPDARIILFGSRAKGNAKPCSDFDIAIDKGSPISFDILYKIQEELDELPTLKSFDIIDMSIVDKSFKELILETGKVLYEGNRNST